MIKSWGGKISSNLHLGHATTRLEDAKKQAPSTQFGTPLPDDDVKSIHDGEFQFQSIDNNKV